VLLLVTVCDTNLTEVQGVVNGFLELFWTLFQARLHHGCTRI